MVDTRDDARKVEVAMLRARVHVRLDRGDRALDALREIAFMPLSTDHYVATQMLTGAAYVRLGQKERGEAILSAAMGKAKKVDSALRGACFAARYHEIPFGLVRRGR
jgi:hypothetical protein